MTDLPLPNVPQVTVDEVKRVVDEHDDVILLDVRSEQEYAQGKIEGSINVPIDELAQKVPTSIPDKDAKIYVYCLRDARSARATDTMIRMGYTQVFDMQDGLLAWRVKDYPLVFS